MRKLNGFICFCVLAMISSTASAQIQIVIDNQVIPTEDIESIVILPNSNLISVTTTVAYTVQASSTEPPPPGAVSITGFSATPSIEEGGTATIIWSTENATSCAASSNLVAWSGDIGLNGTLSTVINTAGTYVLDITCQGDSGPVSSAASIIVTVPPVVDPTTSCATPALSGTTTVWEEFWRVPFPSPGYDKQDVNIGKYGYVALEFNTGNVAGTGFLATVANTISSGIRFGAVSACPGDFNVAPECDYSWGTGGGIVWSTIGESGSCALEPNKTYYFNVTFTDGSDSRSSNCVSSLCYATLQHVQF